MKPVIVAFTVLMSLISFSQTPKKIDSKRKRSVDSIRLIIKNTSNLEIKAKNILMLSQLLRNSDKQESRNLAKRVLKIPLNKISDSLNNIALLRIGVSYFKEKKDSIALVHFLKMDSLYEVSNKIYPSLIMSKVYRADISKFTFTKEGVLHARQILNEGLELSKTIKNEKYQNLMTYKIGDWMGFYSQVEKQEMYLDSAKLYFNKALEYYKKTNNHEYISKIYFSLASVASTEKNYKLAEYYYKLRLSEIEQTKDSIDLGNAHGSLGGFYRKTKNYKKAIEQLNKAQAIQNKYGLDDIDKKIRLTHTLALTHYESNSFKEASDYFNLELKLRDSLFEQKNAKQVLQLETKYQTDKKSQEIEVLKSENEVIEQKQKNQRNILLGGLGITSIAGFFLFFLYQNRKKTNTKLRELDRAKSNFFTNISHEFRTPLTLINTPIENILEDENIDGNRKQQFVIAKRNSDRLLALVNQVLDLSKIDAGELKLHIQKGNVMQLISALSESFLYQAQQKQIQLDIDINNKNEDVFFDKDAVEKMVINLLSNAVKYTPDNGEISCSATINNNKLHIEIKNSGKEISEEDLSNIFERFYQTDDKNSGTGIGLALVKELVELHKGNIKVSSTPKAFTTFTVTLPVDKNSFKNETFIEASTSEAAIIMPNSSASQLDSEPVDEFKNNDQPILLIIEDNADLRALLKQTFENTYNILTAENGETGIGLAIEHIPDIIISDVMMPVKDGVELTQDLKNDERTSHIPIVLLTAKAGDDNKLTGLEVGADDYITKPFNSKLLITKVAKLIENRRLLQQRYSQELVLLPKDISVTNLDEQFLEKVQTTMDTNLVEPTFNVTEFSEAVGMSRMQLHRKLKALTGLTASEFIRSQRLKLAAQLLKSSDINIAQVGYSVGFNDHSYFTKCFRDTYNCTPTEFAKRK